MWITFCFGKNYHAGFWENDLSKGLGMGNTRVVSAGLGKKKGSCTGGSNGYPHFLKISRFGVDNYFFNFSILHNYQLYFPHPMKSNNQTQDFQRFCVL